MLAYGYRLAHQHLSQDMQDHEPPPQKLLNDVATFKQCMLDTELLQLNIGALMYKLVDTWKLYPDMAVIDDAKTIDCAIGDDDYFLHDFSETYRKVTTFLCVIFLTF